MRKTKGQVEAAISKALVQFEKEYMGRGPSDARTYIIRDMVFVRLKGVLTPAEQKLAQDAEGRALIKQVRSQLLEGSRTLLEEMIRHLTGSQVVSLHADISTRTGERIIIFTLKDDLERKLGL
ncbi:MAG TPA: DUF2294 domain-containing protein [Anaerolineae bacterium]|nr:DUF2294 domain-containing protein [Anaerolineae bacterium]